MKHGVTARTLGCLLLAIAIASAAGCRSAEEQAGCNRPPKTFKLKIKTRADHSPERVTDNLGNPKDKVTVCPGDTVQWELKDYEFVIAFKAGTPFGWTTQNAVDDGSGKWVVTGLVLATAPRKIELHYSVDVLGHPPKLDPLIIVDR